MSAIICDACGANDFIESNGYRICKYCGTKQLMFRETQGTQNISRISIDDDIASLLEKCKRDPKNAKRYANLVLDIDANNSEAKKYL